MSALKEVTVGAILIALVYFVFTTPELFTAFLAITLVACGVFVCFVVGTLVVGMFNWNGGKRNE